MWSVLSSVDQHSTPLGNMSMFINAVYTQIHLETHFIISINPMNSNNLHFTIYRPVNLSNTVEFSEIIICLKPKMTKSINVCEYY